MKMLIVGGKLQGVEACYLAQKANIKTLLIDKNPSCLARNLADSFIEMDILKNKEAFLKKAYDCDLILPAMENDAVITFLEQIQIKYHLQIAFDFKAYQITKSKKKSDALFQEHQIPCPKHYPDARIPLLMKPSEASGSEGVEVINCEKTLEEKLQKITGMDQWIIQEYLEGPSFSMEVIGSPGQYKTYEITQIHIDDQYDCCRVTAPCDLETRVKQEFQRITLDIAEKLQLKGIMDVEVILHNDTIKVLEIDARLPSQTPIVVYQTTGINLLEELIRVFIPYTPITVTKNNPRVVLEQWLINKDATSNLGEKVMTQCGPLYYYVGLVEEVDILTDYVPGDEILRMILVIIGKTDLEIHARRNYIFSELKNKNLFQKT